MYILRHDFLNLTAAWVLGVPKPKKSLADEFLRVGLGGNPAGVASRLMRAKESFLVACYGQCPALEWSKKMQQVMKEVEEHGVAAHGVVAHGVVVHVVVVRGVVVRGVVAHGVVVHGVVVRGVVVRGVVVRGVVVHGVVVHGVVVHGVVVHGVVVHGVVVHGVVVRGVVVHGVVVHGVVVHGVVAHGVVVHGVVAHGVVVHGVVAHGVVVHGVAAHGVVVHGVAAHGVAAHGVVAHGVVVHGVAAHGVVAHGAPYCLRHTDIVVEQNRDDFKTTMICAGACMKIVAPRSILAQSPAFPNAIDEAKMVSMETGSQSAIPMKGQKLATRLATVIGKYTAGIEQLVELEAMQEEFDQIPDSAAREMKQAAVC